jgi:hypothetical protein
MRTSNLSLAYLHDDAAALAYLEAALSPNGPTCPHCPTGMTEALLVLVEWAQPVAAWRWLSHWTEFVTVQFRSVGWLIHDGGGVKALAPNVGLLGDDEDAQISGVIRISARSIKRLVRLNESEA